MKKMHKYLITALLIGLITFQNSNVNAGNEDRSGQAGASELLINPWARSSGWANANTANVRGLEAQFLNIAGLAFTKQTELIFSNTRYLSGTDLQINTFGFSQKLGEEGGVIALGVMALSVGDINVTTVDLPEGGIGTFSPKCMNINLSYAKAFSNSIFGGINIKIISEQISDVAAQGIAIDAGIQYVTGELENIKFGISMKNVGPTMKFTGDGLSFRGMLQGNDNELTVEQRSASFELPSLINIGASYDFFLSDDHTITAAGSFTSNSFTKDQYSLGVEYSWKKFLMLRGGYMYEQDIFSDFDAGRSTAHTGPAGGFSIQAPLSKEKGSIFSLDYSYRATNPFSGTHTIGARISL